MVKANCNHNNDIVFEQINKLLEKGQKYLLTFN